jgi:MFS family permease
MLADQLEGTAQSRSIGIYAACFGVGSSLSIIACGAIGAAFGWKWAFVYGALGPLVAASLVGMMMPRGKTRAAHEQGPALLDFRPVLKNRKTLPYIIGYTAHNYELFGQRAWMVAFLVFCASLRSDSAVALAGAATLAALINMMGPVASITGNELAIRFGRSRVIFTAMCLSGIMACGIGWLAGLPLAIVFFVMCIHYGLMLGDSAALTSGVVAATPPEMRGATMAVYSFVGFAGAILAPLVFGMVLDLAGGNQSRAAWGLAFASIGIFGTLSPLARWFYLRRAAA